MLFLILLFYVLAPYIRSFSLFRPRKKRRKRRGQFGHRSLYRFYRIRAKKKDGGKKDMFSFLQVSRPRKPRSGRSQSCCPSLSLCSDVVTCGRSPNGREMRRAIIPHLSAPDKNTASPSPHAPRCKPLLVRLGSLVAPNGGNSGCSSSTIRYQTGEEGDDDRDLPEKEEDEEVSPSHPQGHPPSSSFLCVSREEEQEEEEEDRPRSGQSREHKGEGSFPFATTPQTSFSLSLSSRDGDRI